ncbi:MAG: putative ABC transporter permease [Acetatifactor sp.]
MYHYTIIQWLFFFYLYSFLGWCFESAYVSICERKLTNRGFMRGPFLPIYGAGAITMLVVSMPFQNSILLTYISGCIGATILEYVTCVIMEALFKVRYWDYSDKRFNFQGRICLKSTLTWGVFTVLAANYIQVALEALMLSIPGNVLVVVTFMLTGAILADFTMCFKAAIDLGNLLMKMAKVKSSFVSIQRRLDGVLAKVGGAKTSIVGTVSSAVAGIAEGVSTAKTEISQSISELKNGIEGKLERLKSLVLSRTTEEYPEDVKEEVLDIKAEFAASAEEHEAISNMDDFVQRSLIRSNPRMTSEKYKEALEELKVKASGRFSLKAWKKREKSGEKAEMKAAEINEKE